MSIYEYNANDSSMTARIFFLNQNIQDMQVFMFMNILITARTHSIISLNRIIFTGFNQYIMTTDTILYKSGSELNMYNGRQVEFIYHMTVLSHFSYMYWLE
jgi:hypothetical protein